MVSGRHVFPLTLLELEWEMWHNSLGLVSRSISAINPLHDLGNWKLIFIESSFLPAITFFTHYLTHALQRICGADTGAPFYEGEA